MAAELSKGIYATATAMTARNRSGSRELVRIAAAE
jgi:hypothetical protein